MRSKEPDIKAPDGYCLGGLRRVRKDGSILFSRGWWKAPTHLIGLIVWVHNRESLGDYSNIDVAEPGLHIYEARSRGEVFVCPRSDREDAKSVSRRVRR